MDNFIIFLGWFLVGEDEIFFLKEFVKMYDEKWLFKLLVVFDCKKFQWINNQYMKFLLVDEVFYVVMLQLLDVGLIEKNVNLYKMEWMWWLVEFFKCEIFYVREIVDYVKLFVNGLEDIFEEVKVEM